MERRFEPDVIEPHWRERWRRLGVGEANVQSHNPRFSMVLPAPNITGNLHLGHAVSYSLQDVLARYHRMRGEEVEWCPGLDHAAIATQNVIERQLATEGTCKEVIGRAAFQQRVDRWYRECGEHIVEQMQRLGFSCDWRRSRFNLDETYGRAVRRAFKTWFDAGLMYRGPRIVNWCSRCQSAISDEEVAWREQPAAMYHVRFVLSGGGSVTVGTTRPEMLFGATGLAVSPGDSRARMLAGARAVVPLLGRAVPVVVDDAVSMTVGTGILMVVPGHDATDYDVATRSGLPSITMTRPDGRFDAPQQWLAGLSTAEAHAVMVQRLTDAGHVERVAPFVHQVPHCDRCESAIEPRLSEQWWLRLSALAQPAIDAIEHGEVQFFPARYADISLRWMHNLRDWCVSRQLWLGHPIPVSECSRGHRFAWVDHPTQCHQCVDTTLRHDPDVLDVWFCDAIWTFAALGWPESTPEMARFCPTDVVVTGHDIIFLWITRALMAGYSLLGASPFRSVVLSGTISMPNGARMSKSKGRSVDPLDVVSRHSVDALRVWGALVGTAAQSTRYDEARVAQCQHFATKVWNLTRFLATRLDDGAGRIVRSAYPEPGQLAPEDRWVLARCAAALHRVQDALDRHALDVAMGELWTLTWHIVCDWYVEMAKPRLHRNADPQSRAAAAWTATTVLDLLLRFLHPFMPYVTEECAQRLPTAGDTLDWAPWPALDEAWDETFAATAQDIDALVQVVQDLRGATGRSRVPAAGQQRARLVLDRVGPALSTDDCQRLFELLAPVCVVDQHVTSARALCYAAGALHVSLDVRSTGIVDIDLLGTTPTVGVARWPPLPLAQEA